MSDIEDNAKMHRAIESLSAKQLLAIVFVGGLFSGGGGGALVDRFIFSKDDVVSPIAFEDYQREIRVYRQETTIVLERLARQLDNLNEQLVRLRCETRAARDGYEWWTCYTEPIEEISNVRMREAERRASEEGEEGNSREDSDLWNFAWFVSGWRNGKGEVKWQRVQQSVTRSSITLSGMQLGLLPPQCSLPFIQGIQEIREQVRPPVLEIRTMLGLSMEHPAGEARVESRLPTPTPSPFLRVVMDRVSPTFLCGMREAEELSFGVGL